MSQIQGEGKPSPGLVNVNNVCKPSNQGFLLQSNYNLSWLPTERDLLSRGVHASSCAVHN